MSDTYQPIAPKGPGTFFLADAPPGSPLSYDALQTRRKIAEVMAAKMMGVVPKNPGEGLAHLGQALAYLGTMRRLEEGEKAYSERVGKDLSLYPGAPTSTGTVGTGTSADIEQPPPPIRTADISQMPETSFSPAATTSNLPTGRDELATSILGQGGTTAPIADVSKLPSGPAPLTGPTVRTTWFNAGAPYRDPAGRLWSDPRGQAEGAQKSGLSHTLPGVATPGSQGLGEYHQVTMPDGTTAFFKKSDQGPAAWTGMGLDINAPAAAALGFTPNTFPSGQGGWRVARIGPNLPPGVQEGVPYKVASLGAVAPPTTTISPAMTGALNPNPAIITNIPPAPSPTQLAQAGGAPTGIPKPLAEPQPGPAGTAIPGSQYPQYPVPAKPYLPEPAPINPWETKGYELLRKYPNDPNVKTQAELWIKHGEGLRKAEDTRRAEIYRADITSYEAARRASFEQNDPTKILERQRIAAEVDKLAEEKKHKAEWGNVSPALIEADLKNSIENTKNIPASINAISLARENLEKGMFTGILAGPKLWAAKAYAEATGQPNPKITATEHFMTNVMPLVAQARVSLVGTNNISNQDIKDAKEAAGGRIQLEPDTIRTVLKVAEGQMLQQALQHNKKVLTYAGNEPNALQKAQGLLVPMDQIVPQAAVEKLKANVNNPQAIKDFDEQFMYPGLANIVLRTR